MGLKVIGAGFGRTGTESMKRALEILGFGPCYHMYEVLPHEDRVALWRKITAEEIKPDWNEVFADYNATVDWPGAFYWRELAAHYPEAKILLTVRSSDSWYASMDKTILKILRETTDEASLGAYIGRSVFGEKLYDRDHIIATYERNIADAKAAFPADRLLTYELGSGWPPLCAFLGCDIPGVPYPSGNEEDEFHTRATHG